ncbi:MAG TPA: hemerythrin domain-containing protein [Nocardioides sp.]|jgi:hemerythrin-like domain-containing protein|nr:hemerythrin domain-containing protein [Nocardioides sp.]
MTEHITMNTVIHAAFRRDLARFDTALASFPDGSQERADQLVTAWDNYQHQLHHHHEDEETIFWPAFRELGADEAVTSDLGGEHAQMLSALDHADEVVRRLSGDPSSARAANARAAIGELGEVLREHLAHEEANLEPWVATVRGTPRMKQALVAVRKAHQGGAGTFVAWLLDGAEPDDVTGLKQEMPPPVVAFLNAVPGRHYRKNIATVWTAGAG